ncbi:hypothetical protein FBR05_00435 [Deltaproteobacteria bacterium PRO3]|nr:hypothetical protein [Deltaproteobacteria bacterium PRO3]
MSVSDSPTSTEIQRELKRKSLHLPGLLAPFAFHYYPRVSTAVTAVVCALYYIAELRRLSQKPSLPIIGYLSERLTRSSHMDLAPIFLAVGLGISAHFLPLRAAFAGALLACLCDAFAALIGMKFGVRRIFFLKKTYLGTFAFFVSAVVVLIPLLGPQGALITAMVASLIEALSIEGVDNLLLPILGGVVARYFL